MTLIMAVDTAHGTCSAALAKNNTILSYEHYSEQAKQAERLLPLIESMLERSNFTYGDVNHLVSSTGPGSFTGLRVGLAAMSGVHMATGIPSSGLSTLETLAWRGLHRANINTPIIATVIDARRDQAYLQCFHMNDGLPEATTAPELITLGDIAGALEGKTCTLFGNIAPLKNLPETITQNLSPLHMPDASDVALMASALLEKGLSLPPALPLYIRAPDAKLPTKKPA